MHQLEWGVQRTQKPARYHYTKALNVFDSIWCENVDDLHTCVSFLKQNDFYAKNCEGHKLRNPGDLSMFFDKLEFHHRKAV